MSQLIVRAADRAARAHTSQRRKGEGDIPYVNHCTAVAALVASVTDDEATLAAALLHDTVEDSDATLDDIIREFGPQVAEIVSAVTDAEEITDLPLAERKAKQAAKMRTAPLGAKLVKIADQTSNLTDIVNIPPGWSVEKRTAYLEGTIQVVNACRGVNEALEQKFDEAADRLRATL